MAKRSRQKKLACFASAKVLTPPPQLLANIAIVCNFFLHVEIYFFRTKRPEMDDFREEKKSFGFNGKILLKISIFEENILKMFITDTLAKKYFGIFFCFRTFKAFFFILRRKQIANFSGV